MEEQPLLSVRELVKHFRLPRRSLWRAPDVVRAVDGVSFDISRGKTLGLVGESGCGKTTTGRTILQLMRATAGEVHFKGEDLCLLNDTEMRPFRNGMQIIFQDPYASLDPRMTIGKAIAEPLMIHKLCRTREEARDRVQGLMERVGLNPYFINRYPHEFSGGQRQRIGIARALAVDPDFIVLDEPVSSLDVSIQAQILNLLQDLQDELELTYLFIAHDLRVVRHISDRIAVMYLGLIVEMAQGVEIYDEPLHPYTQALLSAVPWTDPRLARKHQRIILEGEVSSAINPPSGCRFHPRCPIAEDRCRDESPQLREVQPEHWVACHLA
ncbi:MAG: ATP-binding cassette domain-containing protein [Caldilineaceae bacterium]|nr:ATP-binding cassette domain-containing protein [Caldilineaceae bacterium]